MGHEVEDGGRVAESPQREHHQSQVAHGGVGEDSFQVRGGQGHGCRHERCCESDDGHHQQGVRGRFEEGEGPRHQEHTRRRPWWRRGSGR